MIEDNLIMSRFENRIGKCKTPADLEKLCETYLDFRNKPRMTQFGTQTIYIGPNSDSFNTFMCVSTVSDYTAMHMNKHEVYQEVQRTVFQSMFPEMWRMGYVKLKEDRDVANQSTRYIAKVGAVKL